MQYYHINTYHSWFFGRTVWLRTFHSHLSMKGWAVQIIKLVVSIWPIKRIQFCLISLFFTNNKIISDTSTLNLNLNFKQYVTYVIVDSTNFCWSKKEKKFQNCSDLLWEKNHLVIEKNFWNSRLLAENLQNFWDH